MVIPVQSRNRSGTNQVRTNFGASPARGTSAIDGERGAGSEDKEDVGHADKDGRDLSPFEQAVKRVVAGIPRGTVLAYGEVALLAGRPGGARAVVRALNRLSGLPWWRVVRADRTLAQEIAHEQGPRLEQEGVRLNGRRILPKSEHVVEGMAASRQRLVSATRAVKTRAARRQK